MNLFFFFPHLSSHYVSLDSHFCFVKAFDPASFLFWLKKPTTEHQTEFTPYSLVCSPTNINLSLLLSAKCPLHSTQCCVLCAPCAHDCGFIKSHQRYLEGESYLQIHRVIATAYANSSTVRQQSRSGGKTREKRCTKKVSSKANVLTLLCIMSI